MATAEKLTGLRKAAILLICLGEETAARILLELSDERACATSAGRPLLNYVLREMAG